MSFQTQQVKNTDHKELETETSDFRRLEIQTTLKDFMQRDGGKALPGYQEHLVQPCSSCSQAATETRQLPVLLKSLRYILYLKILWPDKCESHMAFWAEVTQGG